VSMTDDVTAAMRGRIRFHELLARPLLPWTRLALCAAVVPLVLSFAWPLWRIRLEAPQYPRGLTLDIYSYKVEGGGRGQHLAEINTLNHYIGMQKIDRAALADLGWIPFAVGILAVLALRVAAIGDVRALIDLAVLAGYLSLFSLGRFAYRMWVFGHHLAPDAPVKVKPFMPPLLGTKPIANFHAESWPRAGGILLGAAVAAMVGLALWHLWRWWRVRDPGQS